MNFPLWCATTRSFSARRRRRRRYRRGRLVFSLVILFGAQFDDDDFVALLLSRRRIRSRVCFLFGRNRCEQIGRFRDWFARKRGHKSAAFVVHQRERKEEDEEEPHDGEDIIKRSHRRKSHLSLSLKGVVGVVKFFDDCFCVFFLSSTRGVKFERTVFFSFSLLFFGWSVRSDFFWVKCPFLTFFGWADDKGGGTGVFFLFSQQLRFLLLLLHFFSSVLSSRVLSLFSLLLTPFITLFLSFLSRSLLDNPREEYKNKKKERWRRRWKQMMSRLNPIRPVLKDV